MNSAVFITVVLAVVAGNVAMMSLIVRGLGDQLGALASRLERVEVKIDGLTETVVRFDERLRRLE